MIARVLAAAGLSLALAAPTLAVEPDEMLKDPALEARAREIGQELRCLVCQNQSIDDSNADLARDLRILVRERLKTGDTDEQAIDFIVARYGDFVLLDPPFKPSTWALWLAAPVVLALGAGGMVLWYRRRAPDSAAPLSPEEERRIAALTDRKAETGR